MFKTSLTIALFISVLSFHNAELKALDEPLTPSETLYKSNMLENTFNVLSIKEESGKILKLSNIYYSYRVSKEVVEKLDEI